MVPQLFLTSGLLVRSNWGTIISIFRLVLVGVISHSRPKLFSNHLPLLDFDLFERGQAYNPDNVSQPIKT